MEVTSPGDPKYVSSISITNKINNISIGKQYQFVATFSPWDAEGFENFTWQSDHNDIATIDHTGLLTAVEEGEATIKLSAKVLTKKGTKELSDEVKIKVIPVMIESIKLNKADLMMLNLTTDTLSVTYEPANAEPIEIVWMSNHETVASVDSGVVTAKSVGNTLITAQVKGTDIKATCNVTVTPLVVTKMQFETEIIQMEAEVPVETKLIFTPESAVNKSVTYKSSDERIAEVNADGVITGHYYRADGLLGEGPVIAAVTATSVVTGVKATCNVEVYSVPDLVTMSVVSNDIVVKTLGISGSINPTLHNNSSKPIRIVRFRLLDRFKRVFVNIPVNAMLEAKDSHTLIDLVKFENVDTPQAAFDFEFDHNSYRVSLIINP